MARIRPLRIEPYSPDALDGDGDGIVQEGTAWERPAGTRLVDAFGSDIANGLTSSTRPQGLRLIDKKGKTVKYTPSYLKGVSEPKKGFTSSLGGTLQEKYGTLGSKLRPIATPKPQAPQPEQTPTPPPEPKFKKQTFRTPLFGKTMVSKPGFTNNALKNPKDGKYVKERRSLHKAINNWYMEKASPRDDSSTEEKTVWFLGGGGGSGKTSAFTGGSIGIPTESLRVDPDEIKTMLPEYREWVNQGVGDAASFVHDESKHVFGNVTHSLVNMNADFVYDTTGNGSYSGLREKVDDLRRKGHKVRARYMTISLEEALLRAEKREQEEGRRVPKDQLIHNHREVSTNVIKALAENLFDDLELYDNSGNSEPKLILRAKNGEVEVLDPKLVAQFMDKSNSLVKNTGPNPAGAHSSLPEGLEASRDLLSRNPEAFEAVKNYTEDGFFNINRLLRDDSDDLTDREYNEAIRQAELLDRAFDESSFSTVKPTKLYRGIQEFVNIDEIDDINDQDALIEASGILKPSDKFKETGFSSTSMLQNKALPFAFGEMGTPQQDMGDETISVPSMMEITIPPGMRMLPGNKAEREVILERGTRYRVVQNEIKIINGRKVKIIKVIATPPNNKKSLPKVIDEEDNYDEF
jgi:predicted ABC-type ATPase